MSKAQSTFIDPDNYYELSKPFESQEVVGNAIEAFWNELYELRNKHRLPDVYIVIRANVKEMGPVMTTLHAGDAMQAELMTAWAFGREQSDRQAMVANILERSGAVSRKKSK